MVFSGLNKKQEQAVIHTEGPLLILAGAGSGKTRVLTHKIAYIVKQNFANTNEILAATFTNKAAEEMKNRVEALLNKQGTFQRNRFLPFIGTFHSICVKILRKDGKSIGIDPNFTIYDTEDQKTAIKQVMRKLGMNIKEFNPRTIREYISSSKNELISPEEYRKYAQGYFQETVSKIYPLYQNLLNSNNALDFDDLIGRTIELFYNNKEILEKYQSLFKYVLVDEYQDTNHAQYTLVTNLAKKRRNICVVGDDDQAIYSWRGATIKNILSFEKDYPETKVVKLEQNYRSSKNILGAAYEVIKHNRSRKHKKLWTEKNEGKKIKIYKAHDEKDESDFIAQDISEMLDKGINANSIAVLYRVNALSRNLEETLLNCGVPYQIYGSISFYQRKEIKDVLAYLRILYNIKDNVSFRRIVNTPPRKIGKVTLDKIVKEAGSESLLEFLLSRKNINYKPLKEFVIIIKDIIASSKDLDLTDLIEYVLNKTGYLKWLEDGSIENQTRLENIKELITVASKYDEMDSNAALPEFLQEVSLIEEQQVKAQNQKDKDRVALMTLHAAKGLEFDNLFIIGLEEGLFPHSRSYTDPQEMEEERRLAYVGITRAKKRLIMTYTESRKLFGSQQDNLISRFIEDIPEDIVNLSSWNDSEILTSDIGSKKESFDNDFIKGDRIEHNDFGKGTILEIKDSLVKVDFGPFVGVKQLALEYANLKRLIESTENLDV